MNRNPETSGYEASSDESETKHESDEPLANIGQSLVRCPPIDILLEQTPSAIPKPKPQKIDDDTALMRAINRGDLKTVAFLAQFGKISEYRCEEALLLIGHLGYSREHSNGNVYTTMLRTIISLEARLQAANMLKKANEPLSTSLLRTARDQAVTATHTRARSF